MSAVYKKVMEAPDICVNSIMGYAKCKRLTPKVNALMMECLREAVDAATYTVCYRIMPKDELISLCPQPSVILRASMSDCREALLFAATIGAGVDMLIKKYSVSSPAHALMLQAVATERIEALCDSFCDEMAETLKGDAKYLKGRKSPGYGDLPLEMQKNIFAALDCERNLGVYLNSSLLMTPTKSVTAFAGIKPLE